MDEVVDKSLYKAVTVCHNKSVRRKKEVTERSEKDTRHRKRITRSEQQDIHTFMVHMLGVNQVVTEVETNVAKSVAPVLASALDKALNPENGNEPNYEAAFALCQQTLAQLRIATDRKITRQRKTKEATK